MRAKYGSCRAAMMLVPMACGPDPAVASRNELKGVGGLGRHGAEPVDGGFLADLEHVFGTRLQPGQFAAMNFEVGVRKGFGDGLGRKPQLPAWGT